MQARRAVNESGSLPRKIVFAAICPVVALVALGLFVVTDFPGSDRVLRLALTAGLVLFGCGGAFLAAFLFLRRTDRLNAFLSRIIAFAEEAASGNFDAFPPESGVEEIDSLFTSLRAMRQNLHEKSVEAERLAKEAHELSLLNKKISSDAESRIRFFNNISHEVRTPMNAILGIVEILLNSGELDEKLAKRIVDIKMSSETLLSIINDILDISRLESGKMPLVYGDFDFRMMLDNVTALASSLAAAKNLEFAFKVRGDMPGFLIGDDVRVRQVLLNLIGNAVKFTSAGKISLTLTIFDESLEFAVSDTGIGIKSEDLSRIFDPFIQAEYVKNRSIKGTGLGLFICKTLAERMNGSIKVESVYGRGSIFTFAMPKVVSLNASSPAQSAPAAGYQYDKSLQILVVDDSEINLSVCSGLIETWYGLKCDTALSGAEALRKVAEKDYNIIFMDHMMSEMDGVETTAKIREMGGKYAVLPIVAFTANAVRGARELLLSAGMNAFIPKPLLKSDMDEVLSTLLPAHLRRERNLDVPEMGKPAGEAQIVAFSPLVRGAAQIAGLNVASGLALVGGSQKVFEGSLRLMSSHIPQIGRLLGEAAERGDLHKLRIHAHSLKSSLAMIGADGFSAMARELEEQAAADNLDMCRNSLPDLLRQLRSIGQDLNVLCRNNAPTAKVPGDPETLSAGLRALRADLVAFRYNEVTAGLKKLEGFDYDPDVSEALANIAAYVDVFDYEGALERLDKAFPEAAKQSRPE
ncbi:MAG: response regulator [Desulfovibrio sp.]|jgi:signal transduction histidine kinase/CheY-like chemotaxis protein/HPt (histidine-containing phosphotransfer) domain-containing protein|nr:response regulator [Desulfovibrio sp.]